MANAPKVVARKNRPDLTQQASNIFPARPDIIVKDAPSTGASHTTTTQRQSAYMKIKEIIAGNIAYLLTRREWSQSHLGRRAGIAPKSVSNMLNLDSPIQPSIETVDDACRRGLGVPMWMICLDIQEKELLESRQLQRLIEAFARLKKDGRDAVLRTVEQELRYQDATKASDDPT